MLFRPHFLQRGFSAYGLRGRRAPCGLRSRKQSLPDGLGMRDCPPLRDLPCGRVKPAAPFSPIVFAQRVCEYRGPSRNACPYPDIPQDAARSRGRRPAAQEMLDLEYVLALVVRAEVQRLDNVRIRL